MVPAFLECLEPRPIVLSAAYASSDRSTTKKLCDDKVYLVFVDLPTSWCIVSV